MIQINPYTVDRVGKLQQTSVVHEDEKPLHTHAHYELFENIRNG